MPFDESSSAPVKGDTATMAQTLDRLAAVQGKASAEGAAETVAEIDAKEFRRARQDPKLHRFARAADERLQKLRAAGQID